MYSLATPVPAFTVTESHVDLTKPTVRPLDTVKVPTVGELVDAPQVYYSNRCGTPVGDPLDGYTCNRAIGHDEEYRHTAVGFHGYGVGGDPDEYVVRAVAEPLPIPTGAEHAAVLARLELAERQVRDATTSLERQVQREADIREYVIARMHDRDICVPGTVRFLHHFGMELPEREFAVSYTVRVNVTASSASDAEELITDSLSAAVRDSVYFNGPASDYDVEHDTTEVTDSDYDD